MQMSQCIGSNVALSQTVSRLWSFSISDRTKVAYETGYNHFLNFLLLNGVILVEGKPCLVTEDVLIYFVAHCFKNLKLQYSTIKLYLSGIRYQCIQNNIDSPFQYSSNSMEKISMFLNSVKRLQKPVTRNRLPITFDILQQICRKLKEGIFSAFTDCMLFTAFVVAFYGFLRCGEFTVHDAKLFDKECNLCLSDISFQSDYAVLHLKQSKTDPFRKGVDIQLHKLNHEFCPYTALNSYLLLRKAKGFFQSYDPLFINESGQALERNFFISKLKHLLDLCGLDSQLYNGHSFRIGAATSAGKNNIEDHLIKTLGRWKSSSYCRYIKTCKSVIKKAQQKLSSF